MFVTIEVHQDCTAHGLGFRARTTEGAPKNRYDVPEAIAETVVSGGFASAVEVVEQRLDDGSVPDEAARAAVLARVQALAPLPPPNLDTKE